MPRLVQITPFVLCRSLDGQIGFYRDVLGFDVGFRQDNYAFLRRDGAALRLIETDCDPEAGTLGKEQSFYIDVTDLDGVYADMAPRLARLAKGRVRAPFDQPYGQREFHVLDEEGAMVFFGESIT